MTNNKGCAWLSNGFYSETFGGEYFKSCCRIRQSYQTYEELHASMLDPEVNYENLKHTACVKCYKEENTGSGDSMRLNAPTVGDASPGELAFLQVTFSNFCNFKCVYCDPQTSTSIELERQENLEFYNNIRDDNVGMTPNETFNYEKKILSILENSNINKLTYVGIFGGEPFMARHIEDLLELLETKSNPENISLQINTNASIFPKEKIISYIKKYKRVDFRVSCEAYGGLAGYIRNGLNWEIFERNTLKYRDLFKNLKNINFKIHMSNNTWNVNVVNDFFDWANTNELDILTRYVYVPEYSNPQKVLTQEQREIAITRIQSHDTAIFPKEKQKLINFLKINDYDERWVDQFKYFTNNIDRIRNQSLREINPELHDWIFG